MMHLGALVLVCLLCGCTAMTRIECKGQQVECSLETGREILL